MNLRGLVLTVTTAVLLTASAACACVRDIPIEITKPEPPILINEPIIRLPVITCPPTILINDIKIKMRPR